MASNGDKLLTMSLDDIIKLKRQKQRGGKVNQRGQGRIRKRNRGGSNAANVVGQYSDDQRGRQGITTGRRGRGSGRRGGKAFGNRGGRKGLQVVTSKFGIRGVTRNITAASLQGRQPRKAGIGGRVGPSGKGNSNMDARRNIIQRIRYRGEYTDDFQARGAPSTSASQLLTERLQQMQRAIANSQQVNRKKARNAIVNQRRGVVGGMKTSSNLGDPLRVRVGSGTIVRGLRSDELLLQKIRQTKKSQSVPELDRLEVLRDKRNRSQNLKNASLDSNSIVSLSSHRGLTVSIKNNMMSHAVRNGITSRNRSRVSRHKMKRSQDNSFAPATFTIINDRMSSSDSDFEVLPEPPKRITKRNIITTRDARPRSTTALSLGSDNLRTLPEPHRQILDPKIQKEIALLQGKDEVTLNSGPGPGVKGFKHVPSQTTRSLNERFTNERMVTV